MISRFDEITGLFEEIDRFVEERTKLFVMGGAVLLYHGIKSATKDIDIVISDKKEFDAFENALKKIGFDGKIPTKEYKTMEISNIFVRGDFRIDLFHRKVCRGFSVSDGMMKRANMVHDLKHLRLFLCSKEDVFLFKTMTEREGDLEDCLTLAQRGLDWNAILEELRHQIKTTGNSVWITWIGERLDILEDKGLNIPIMKDVNKLRKEYFDEYEKKIKDKN